MRFERYITEEATWSDYMKVFKFNRKNAEKIKKQVIKDLKIERVKNPMTKFAGVGKSFDVFMTPDKMYRIEMVGGTGPHGTYKTSGKTKAVWRIWDEHVGHYHPDQHTTLEKAKEGLANYLMRRGKVRIPL